jgi:hypothetical protein
MLVPWWVSPLVNAVLGVAVLAALAALGFVVWLSTVAWELVWLGTLG